MKIFIQRHNTLISLLISLVTINCDPTTNSLTGLEGQQQDQLRNKEERLAELVQQEEELKNKAKQSISAILSFETPTNPFFELESEELDKNIKKAKKDPKAAEKLWKEVQSVQTSLQVFMAELSKPTGRVEVNNLHPTIQNMVNKVLTISAICNALAKNRPINPSKLREKDKIWYENIIAQYTSFANNVNQFITFVLWGEAQRLYSVIDAELALFQNIYEQHQLKQIHS